MNSSENYSVIKVDYNNPQHKAHLADMLIHYSADLMGGGIPLERDIAENSIKLMKEKSYAFSFLCFSGETPIGFANCFESIATFAASTIINIHDFAIIDAHRGQGLSQMLLQAIEDYGRENNAYKITLEVLEGNKPARAAYKKFGFDGYQLDPQFGNALFWQKKLNS